MIQDVHNPVGGFVEINGNIGCAQSEDGEIGDVPFRPVGREKPDAIAGLNPKLIEGIRETGYAA